MSTSTSLLPEDLPMRARFAPYSSNPATSLPEYYMQRPQTPDEPALLPVTDPRHPGHKTFVGSNSNSEISSDPKPTWKDAYYAPMVIDPLGRSNEAVLRSAQVQPPQPSQPRSGDVQNTQPVNEYLNTLQPQVPQALRQGLSSIHLAHTQVLMNQLEASGRIGTLNMLKSLQANPDRAPPDFPERLVAQLHREREMQSHIPSASLASGVPSGTTMADRIRTAIDAADAATLANYPMNLRKSGQDAAVPLSGKSALEDSMTAANLITASYSVTPGKRLVDAEAASRHEEVISNIDALNESLRVATEAIRELDMSRSSRAAESNLAAASKPDSPAVNAAISLAHAKTSQAAQAMQPPQTGDSTNQSVSLPPYLAALGESSRNRAALAHELWQSAQQRHDEALRAAWEAQKSLMGAERRSQEVFEDCYEALEIELRDRLRSLEREMRAQTSGKGSRSAEEAAILAERNEQAMALRQLADQLALQRKDALRLKQQQHQSPNPQPVSQPTQLQTQQLPKSARAAPQQGAVEVEQKDDEQPRLVQPPLPTKAPTPPHQQIPRATTALQRPPQPVPQNVPESSSVDANGTKSQTPDDQTSSMSTTSKPKAPKMLDERSSLRLLTSSANTKAQWKAAAVPHGVPKSRTGAAVDSQQLASAQLHTNPNPAAHTNKPQVKEQCSGDGNAQAPQNPERTAVKSTLSDAKGDEAGFKSVVNGFDYDAMFKRLKNLYTIRNEVFKGDEASQATINDAFEKVRKYEMLIKCALRDSTEASASVDSEREVEDEEDDPDFVAMGISRVSRAVAETPQPRKSAGILAPEVSDTAKSLVYEEDMAEAREELRAAAEALREAEARARTHASEIVAAQQVVMGQARLKEAARKTAERIFAKIPELARAAFENKTLDSPEVMAALAAAAAAEVAAAGGYAGFHDPMAEAAATARDQFLKHNSSGGVRPTLIPTADPITAPVTIAGNRVTNPAYLPKRVVDEALAQVEDKLRQFFETQHPQRAADSAPILTLDKSLSSSLQGLQREVLDVIVSALRDALLQTPITALPPGVATPFTVKAQPGHVEPIVGSRPTKWSDKGGNVASVAETRPGQVNINIFPERANPAAQLAAAVSASSTHAGSLPPEADADNASQSGVAMSTNHNQTTAGDASSQTVRLFSTQLHQLNSLMAHLDAMAALYDEESEARRKRSLQAHIANIVASISRDPTLAAAKEVAYVRAQVYGKDHPGANLHINKLVSASGVAPMSSSKYGVDYTSEIGLPMDPVFARLAGDFEAPKSARNAAKKFDGNADKTARIAFGRAAPPILRGSAAKPNGVGVAGRASDKENVSRSGSKRRFVATEIVQQVKPIESAFDVAPAKAPVAVPQALQPSAMMIQQFFPPASPQPVNVAPLTLAVSKPVAAGTKSTATHTAVPRPLSKRILSQTAASSAKARNAQTLSAAAPGAQDSSTGKAPAQGADATTEPRNTNTNLPEQTAGKKRRPEHRESAKENVQASETALIEGEQRIKSRQKQIMATNDPVEELVQTLYGNLGHNGMVDESYIQQALAAVPDLEDRIPQGQFTSACQWAQPYEQIDDVSKTPSSQSRVSTPKPPASTYGQQDASSHSSGQTSDGDSGAHEERNLTRSPQRVVVNIPLPNTVIGDVIPDAATPTRSQARDSTEDNHGVVCNVTSGDATVVSEPDSTIQIAVPQSATSTTQASMLNPSSAGHEAPSALPLEVLLAVERCLLAASSMPGSVPLSARLTPRGAVPRPDPSQGHGISADGDRSLDSSRLAAATLAKYLDEAKEVSVRAYRSGENGTQDTFDIEKYLDYSSLATSADASTAQNESLQSSRISQLMDLHSNVPHTYNGRDLDQLSLGELLEILKEHADARLLGVASRAAASATSDLETTGSSLPQMGGSSSSSAISTAKSETYSPSALELLLLQAGLSTKSSPPMSDSDVIASALSGSGNMDFSTMTDDELVAHVLAFAQARGDAQLDQQWKQLVDLTAEHQRQQAQRAEERRKEEEAKAAAIEVKTQQEHEEIAQLATEVIRVMQDNDRQRLEEIRSRDAQIKELEAKLLEKEKQLGSEPAPALPADNYEADEFEELNHAQAGAISVDRRRNETETEGKTADVVKTVVKEALEEQSQRFKDEFGRLDALRQQLMEIAQMVAQQQQQLQQQLEAKRHERPQLETIAEETMKLKRKEKRQRADATEQDEKETEEEIKSKEEHEHESKPDQSAGDSSENDEDDDVDSESKRDDDTPTASPKQPSPRTNRLIIAAVEEAVKRQAQGFMELLQDKSTTLEELRLQLEAQQNVVDVAATVSATISNRYAEAVNRLESDMLAIRRLLAHSRPQLPLDVEQRVLSREQAVKLLKKRMMSKRQTRRHEKRDQEAIEDESSFSFELGYGYGYGHAQEVSAHDLEAIGSVADLPRDVTSSDELPPGMTSPTTSMLLDSDYEFGGVGPNPQLNNSALISSVQGVTSSGSLGGPQPIGTLLGGPGVSPLTTNMLDTPGRHPLDPRPDDPELAISAPGSTKRTTIDAEPHATIPPVNSPAAAIFPGITQEAIEAARRRQADRLARRQQRAQARQQGQTGGASADVESSSDSEDYLDWIASASSQDQAAVQRMYHLREAGFSPKDGWVDLMDLSDEEIYVDPTGVARVHKAANNPPRVPGVAPTPDTFNFAADPPIDLSYDEVERLAYKFRGARILLAQMDAKRRQNRVIEKNLWKRENSSGQTPHQALDATGATAASQMPLTGLPQPMPPAMPTTQPTSSLSAQPTPISTLATETQRNGPTAGQHAVPAFGAPSDRLKEILAEVGLDALEVMQVVAEQEAEAVVEPEHKFVKLPHPITSPEAIEAQKLFGQTLDSTVPLDSGVRHSMRQEKPAARPYDSGSPFVSLSSPPVQPYPGHASRRDPAVLDTSDLSTEPGYSETSLDISNLSAKLEEVAHRARSTATGEAPRQYPLSGQVVPRARSRIVEQKNGITPSRSAKESPLSTNRRKHATMSRYHDDSSDGEPSATSTSGSSYSSYTSSSSVSDSTETRYETESSTASSELSNDSDVRRWTRAVASGRGIVSLERPGHTNSRRVHDPSASMRGRLSTDSPSTSSSTPGSSPRMAPKRATTSTARNTAAQQRTAAEDAIFETRRAKLRERAQQMSQQQR